MRAAAASSGACARRAGAAQNAQTTHEQDEHAESDGDAEERLHAVDGIGHGLVRRDGEHVARVGKHKRADELTAERCRICAGDGEPARRATRGAPPETSARPGRGALPTARRAGSRASTRRASPPTEDPRRAARSRRRRAGFANAASAPARARRGMPRREPTTARDLWRCAFPRRPLSTPSQPTARPAATTAGSEEHRVTERAARLRGGDDGRRHHSTRAANAAADSLDLRMKPRAPQASIRLP